MLKQFDKYSKCTVLLQDMKVTMDILGRHGFEVELEDTSPGRCSLAAIYMKRENILSRFWFGEKMEKIEEKILNHLVKKTDRKSVV